MTELRIVPACYREWRALQRAKMAWFAGKVTLAVAAANGVIALTLWWLGML